VNLRLLSLLAAGVGVTALTSAAALAQTITIKSPPVAPPPSFVGSGLLGSYYGQPGVADNDAADAFIQNNTPLATFLATTVDYPQGFDSTVDDSTILSDFLGADFATFSDPALGSNTLGGHLMTFTGFMNVTLAMDTDPLTDGIQFGLETASDDGTTVDIAGQRIIDNGGLHGFQFVGADLSFASEGLYPIDIHYYEGDGGTGVEFYGFFGGEEESFFGAASVPGGAAPVFSGEIIFPSSNLFASAAPFAAPEPGDLALLAAAVVPAGMILRRRRRTA